MTDILARAKQAAGVKHDYEMAAILGMAQNNFCQRKRRGSLIEPLLAWADANGVNVQWLLYGEEKVQADLPALKDKMALTRDEAVLIVALRELPEEKSQRHKDKILADFLRAKK